VALIKTLVTAVLLTASAYCCADPLTFDTGRLFGSGAPLWGDISLKMSPDSYEQASRRNQRNLKKTAQRLLGRTLTTLGVPNEGIALSGAAIGLATKGLKFNLNESKTLALGLNKVTSEKRGIYLNFKLAW
jgi:hypothetical protein